jgi:MoaA/NifB/PqqE/SkfB family radical SAM enzyme
MTIVISVVEWRVTGACNLRCVYCYGPDHRITADGEQTWRVAEAICRFPASVVRISGGEPLLVRNIDKVVRFLREKGMLVVLSTNGTRFGTLRGLLEPHLSKLNLSLDGYSEETHSLNGRTAASFRDVHDILRSFLVAPPQFKVKVGTVITSRNMVVPDLLDGILTLIVRFPVDRWKIYQYVPEGPMVDPSLRVPDDFFTHLHEDIGRRIDCRKQQLDIAFSSAASRDAGYFIVQPRGEVLVPVGDSSRVLECPLGNILSDELATIMDRWEKISSISHHLGNLNLVGDSQRLDGNG